MDMNSELGIRLFVQNIWGNMGANQAIANRNDLIRDLIFAYEPDVCCFQECNPRTSRAGTTAIQTLLAERYAEAPTTAGSANFTPVFYLRESYRLVESGWHLYTGGPERNDCNSKSITWAVLADKRTGISFGICSTHFWWKSDTPLDNQQRLQNGAELCETMAMLAQRYAIPVFAAGDLNCGAGSAQGSEPYRFLLDRGLLDTRAAAAVSTDAFTHHAYPVLNANGIYVNGGQPARTLDHAFVTNDPRVRIERFQVETSQNALDSSDHCPLLVDATISAPSPPP
jgi:endonuclease/exonuclease/phosphatase family metal-dependent hydrolase